MLLVSPTVLDEETKRQLDKLPTVSILVAPDLEHYLQINKYKELYPKAKVVGPAGLSSKGVKVDIELTDVDREKTLGPSGEVRALFFSGFKNKDIALLHIPTRTLIQADLIFNLPSHQQYSQSPLKAKVTSFPSSLFVWLMKPGSGQQKRLLWYALGSKRKEMSRDATIVDGWDFDRIIPCHGDVVNTGGKELWRKCYAWYLGKAR